MSHDAIVGPPGLRATAGDGARVGIAIGVVALAAAMPLGGALTAAWWVPAAIPAGAVAGGWAGPRISVAEPVPPRLVASAALIATLVGDAAISLALLVGSQSARAGGPIGMLAAAASAMAAGLITVGWFAMLVLLPVAAAAIAIVRARAARPAAKLPPRRGPWVGGIVVGVASGCLALTFPIAGYEIGLLFVAGALLGERTVAAIAGALFGAGAGWLALLANGTLRCDPASCVPPNLGPWLLVGGAMTVAGVALSVVAWGRR